MKRYYLLFIIEFVYLISAQSPCPSNFEYVSDGNYVYGLVHLWPDGPLNSLLLRVNFTIAGRLNSMDLGRLEPIGSDRLLNEYNNGNRISFRVYFPRTNSLPLLTALTVNDRIICVGPGDIPSPTRHVTTISLQSFLFLMQGGRPGVPGRKPIETTKIEILGIYKGELNSTPNIQNPQLDITYLNIPADSSNPNAPQNSGINKQEEQFIQNLLSQQLNPAPSTPAYQNRPTYQNRPFHQNRPTNQIRPTNQNKPIYEIIPIYEKGSEPQIQVVEPPRNDLQKIPHKYTSNQNEDQLIQSIINQQLNPAQSIPPYQNRPTNQNKPEYELIPIYENDRDSQTEVTEPPRKNTQTVPDRRPEYPNEPPAPNWLTTKPPQTAPEPVFIDRIPEMTTQRQIETFNNVQCGVSASDNTRVPLIYNGESFEKGDWPWLVAIYKRKDGGLSFICSGTLVSDRHVITAAHCMQTKTTLLSIKDIVVKVGVYNLEDWGDDVVLTRTLASAAIHEAYNASTLVNDILVITFDRRVQFSIYIRPACLWAGSSDLSNVVGTAGVVTGWGQSELGGAGRGEPRMVRMPIVSTAKCRASKADFHKLTSAYTLCAGDRNGAGPCLGDSGAGLYLRDGGQWRLRGVVSLSLRAESGDQSCNLNEYIVFTDAAQYFAWIQYYMNI